MFVLAAGATFGPAKRWPEQHFATLGRQLARGFDAEPVLIGSRDPDEVRLCDRLAASLGGRNLAGQTDLPTLAAVLHRALLFVGNDSGPMHLAAALGTPTVGIFGSTSPGWTAPRGRRAAVAGPHPVDCTPCFRKQCPIGLPCLVDLAPSSVWAVIESVLAEEVTS